MVCGGAALAGALVILLSSGALTNRAEPAVYTAISLPPVSDPWQGDEPQCVKLPPEELATGQVGKATWQAWIPGVRFSQGERWLSVVKPGAGRTALRQAFEPSEEGSPRVLVGATLPAARTYRVVQSVYFEPEFEWGGAENQGGKFGFGLGGGTSPSGGTMDPAGFTARWMWRGNRDGTARLVRVERIHMEQDAGKSIHDMDPSMSFVDLNRTGVALMEIVSFPDIRGPEEAAAYLTKLRQILRYLGTCNGDMQSGAMRADVNVIDFDNLQVRRPVTTADLPAGGVRFLQPVSGYAATFVNGVQTRANDTDTGERPGRLIRRR